MTARLEAARAAVHTAVKMYAPVHAAFSDEATRQLNKALGELEAAAVDAHKAAQPPAPPVVPPAPAPVAFVPPVREEAAGPVTAPAPAELATPKFDEVAADPKPKASKKAK
jgi:hypothetical protein